MTAARTTAEAVPARAADPGRERATARIASETSQSAATTSQLTARIAGPDVVALDLGVVVDGGERERDDDPGQGEEGVARAADGHDDGRRDEREREGAELARHRVSHPPRRGGGVRERAGLDRAAELLAEDHVEEPVQGARLRVDERPAERDRERELQVEERGGPEDGDGAPEDHPRAQHDPWLHGEHEEPDAGREQDRGRLVAERHPVGDRRGDEPPVRARRGRRGGGPPRRRAAASRGRRGAPGARARRRGWRGSGSPASRRRRGRRRSRGPAGRRAGRTGAWRPPPRRR